MSVAVGCPPQLASANQLSLKYQDHPSLLVFPISRQSVLTTLNILVLFSETLHYFTLKNVFCRTEERILI